MSLEYKSKNIIFSFKKEKCLRNSKKCCVGFKLHKQISKIHIFTDKMVE